MLWQRIAVEVARLDARPTQPAIADQLEVSRARVQRAIAANRDAWEQLIATANATRGQPHDHRVCDH